MAGQCPGAGGTACLEQYHLTIWYTSRVLIDVQMAQGKSMSNEVRTEKQEMPFPVIAGVVIGVVSALVVGASFKIINYWPLPPSVAPYFGFRMGAVWGAIAGFVFGSIIAFLTDDRHFPAPESER